MPKKYIITGKVLFADDDRLLEGRVQAFDGDLPSMERRGLPQLFRSVGVRC